MEYVYSSLLGIALGIVLMMTTWLVTLIHPRTIVIAYALLGAYLPFAEFGIPVFPYVGISVLAALKLYSMNNRYAKTEATSYAPRAAAGCLGMYFIAVTISYIASWCAV